MHELFDAILDGECSTDNLPAHVLVELVMYIVYLSQVGGWTEELKEMFNKIINKVYEINI